MTSNSTAACWPPDLLAVTRALKGHLLTERDRPAQGLWTPFAVKASKLCVSGRPLCLGSPTPWGLCIEAENLGQGLPPISPFLPHSRQGQPLVLTLWSHFLSASKGHRSQQPSPHHRGERGLTGQQPRWPRAKAATQTCECGTFASKTLPMVPSEMRTDRNASITSGTLLIKSLTLTPERQQRRQRSGRARAVAVEADVDGDPAGPISRRSRGRDRLEVQSQELAQAGAPLLGPAMPWGAASVLPCPLSGACALNVCSGKRSA